MKGYGGLLLLFPWSWDALLKPRQEQVSGGSKKQQRGR